MAHFLSWKGCNMDDTPPAKPKAPRKAAPRKAAGKAALAKPETAKKPRKTASVRAAKADTATRTAMAKDTLKNTTDKLREQAESMKTQAGKTARTAAITGKDKAGSAMQNLSKLIGDTAGSIDDKLGSQYGDYARYAAEAIAGAAATLDRKDIDELVTDARDFVRKSPAVAIGTAAIVGFVLMRLAKSAKAPAHESEEA